MHSASKRVPRRLRLRFWLTRTLRWLVPEARCFSFPVAVRRNRFLVALCVFILCDMAVVVFPMKLLLLRPAFSQQICEMLVKLESRILERLFSFLKVFSQVIPKSVDFAPPHRLAEVSSGPKWRFCQQKSSFLGLNCLSCFLREQLGLPRRLPIAVG